MDKEKLKKEFVKKFGGRAYDTPSHVYHDLVGVYAEVVADFWLEKLSVALSQRNKEIREKCEGMKIKTKLDLRPSGNFSDLTEVSAYNQALDSIINFTIEGE